MKKNDYFTNSKIYFGGQASFIRHTVYKSMTHSTEQRKT